MTFWTRPRALAAGLMLALVTVHPGPSTPADPAPALAPHGLAADTSSRLSRTNLLLFHDAQGRVATVRSIGDWQKRRAEIVRGAEAIMGPLPGVAKRGPLQYRVLNEDDCGDFVRRQISFVSEPGGRVPAFLLIPKSVLGKGHKAPGVLCLHQRHPEGMKIVVGLGDSPDDEYAVELAKRGYVCIATPYPYMADYEPDLPKLGYQSGTMKAIWDNIRALDLLDSLPFVRHGSFGAIGHSLGAHNAIFTAIFDPRIKVVVSSGGFDSFLEHADDIRGWGNARYMPKLLDYHGRIAEVPFDFHELIGALAPDHVFVSAPLRDAIFKMESVDEIAAAARPVFELYRVPGNLRVEHPDCGHEFPSEVRQMAYAEIDRALK